jgi:hypothetical protein
MNIHTYSLIVDTGVSGIHDDAGVGSSRGGFEGSLYGLVPPSATNAADGATGRWRLRYKIPRTTTAMTAVPPMTPPTMAPTGVFEPPEEEDGDEDEDEDKDEGEEITTEVAF